MYVLTKNNLHVQEDELRLPRLSATVCGLMLIDWLICLFVTSHRMPAYVLCCDKREIKHVTVANQYSNSNNWRRKKEGNSSINITKSTVEQINTCTHKQKQYTKCVCESLSPLLSVQINATKKYQSAQKAQENTTCWGTRTPRTTG